MSYVTAFVFLLSTLTVGLLASDPVYECASRLNTTDIPGGPFYLRLEAANESTSMPVSNGSCPIDDQRIQDLSCMCGEKLLRQQSEIQALFDESCEFYDEAIVGNASPLGFCERALKGTGRCVTFEPSQGTVSGVNEFTADSLGAKLDEINRILLGFKGVLDRTIVHVYLRSKGHRCQCLEYYKRWLCTSKLSFVGPSNTSESNSSAPTNGTRLRPCIGVCYDVLQTCPYYLPSRFQPRPPNDSSSDRFFQVIYGGYPAFDCPRRQFCEMQDQNCTYSFEQDSCFGRNDSSTLSSSVILISLFLSLSRYVS